MRKLFFLILLAIIIPFCSDARFTSSHAQADQPNDVTNDGVNLLFVLTADTASLQAINNKPGYYTLTLSGVSPYLTYFSDRPNRTQGVTAVENFVNAWGAGSNNFNENPPNAVFTATKVNMLENNNKQFYVVTMFTPKYNVQSSMMQFVVTPLQQKIFFKDIRFNNITIVIDSKRH